MAVAVVTIVLSSIAATLSPVVASAADVPVDSFTPSQEATSYSYYTALGGCIQHNLGQGSPDIPVKVSEEGNPTTAEMFDDNQAFGYVYPGGTKTDCKDIATEALALWGWTSTGDFLTDIGYTFKLDTADATSKYVGISDESARLASFQKAVQKKVYGGSAPSLSDAANYAIALNAFALKGGACTAKDLGAYSSLGSNEKQLVDAKSQSDAKAVKDLPLGTIGTAQYAKLSVVDSSTGAGTDHGYVYLLSTSTIAGRGSVQTDLASQITYGYHSTAKQPTCSSLVSTINKDAGAYMGWFKSHTGKKDDGALSNTCFTNPTAPGCPPPDTATSCNIDGVGWLLCPVLTAGANLADSAYGFVADNFLSTDPSLVNTDPNATTSSGQKIGTGTYTAWKIMQGLANVAFAIVFLIIIFSQLTNVGVSNFGVKKLLPRLIIGAVLVNVSFYVCQIAIDLSNILGYSLKDLLAGVATQVANSGGGTPVSTSDQSSNLVGILGLVITAAAISWINLSAVMLAIVGAVITLLIIFVLLIARKALIILLVVIAPLAFVAYLLPNTEAWFKRWRTLFVQLLLLFPIIGVLMGACALASAILKQVAGDDIVMKTVAYMVLVVPLIAAVPLLKGSLDGVGKLGGAIQGFGSKIRGGAQKGAKTAYDRSHLGQFREYRRGEADKRRGLIRGGVYKGSNRNPLNWIRNARSAGNQGLNQVTGRFGDRLEAAGIEAANKQEAGEIAAAQQLLQSRVTRDKRAGNLTAKEALVSAMRRGDIVQAKAAQNVMFNQGAGGLNDFYAAVKAAQEGGAARPEALDGLRENISTNHGQMVKTKAADISKWSGLGGNLSDLTADANTWAGLSQADLAGQTSHSLQRAADAGLLDGGTASDLLSNTQLNGSLDPAQVAALTQAAGRAPGTAPTTGAAAGAVGSEWVNSEHTAPSPAPTSTPKGSFVDGQGRSTPGGANEDYHDRMAK